MTQTFEQWAESEGLDMSVDWTGELTSPVTAWALRGWEAARSAGQEPIYQVRWHEGDPWVDIDGAMYATYADRMHDKRIVYAAPVNGGERDEDGVDLREAAEMAVEAFGLLGGLIGQIRAKGNYSQETTIRFLEEAQMCLYRLRGLIGGADDEAESARVPFLKKWRSVIEAMPMGAADAQQVGVDARVAELEAMLTEVTDCLAWLNSDDDGHIMALTDRARAALTSPAKVPDAVMRALDRMSTPLHDSRLSGLTAELDAANIKTIRDYVLSGAVPAKVVGDDQHPDDAAVDRFSVAMKAKLAKKRAQGRGGWDDERICSPDDLACMLVDHVRKGDPVDVGNLAMMLFNRPDAGAALCRAALSADGGEDKRDAERLDFMIEQQAWVQWTVRDGSIRQCQVYTQDEDENYHILSGEDQFFSTPREAIDAAIAANQSGKGGEQ